MNRRTIVIVGISLAAVLIVVGIVLVINTKPANDDDQSRIPENPQAIEDVYSYLDDQTRKALDNNLRSYTGRPLDKFTVQQNTYFKTKEGVRFQVKDNDTRVLYDIETEPNMGNTFNYVFVTCAPEVSQEEGVVCNLKVGDE